MSSAELPLVVEVEIEIPRGSCLKRGSSEKLDFLSPLPCLYNYGSVRAYIGGDGDYLDAVVLGPRLMRGARVHVPVRAAVGISERGIYEDKLICSDYAISQEDRRRVELFLRCYVRCKAWLNVMRGLSGSVHWEGWVEVENAMGRALPSPPSRSLGL